ncbi:Ubiquitin-activating enzyme E1-like [Wickerhamiella sorbophila]|uniref:Ubiquitin-activating enzyme E1-like n=1 Tax=Wickerhamiella sorbophila TaxID=45607 RepID=A0A2T0FJ53_9ASCO|nr:Ubiquitin-activating enzyme E1-like [Wickerhamiella sorbophila]PRT54969.1 Ubiquitin-activating enzyme E1-like [Wickerhamiella sorbophila]
MSSTQRGLRTLLGENAVKRIRTSKVLLVGAGGIGCELIKELVVAGFGEIHLVDLDTIDLSNLNRQFLFSQQHIKKPKALVARDVAKEFNPNVNIVAYQDNIMDAKFSVKWFESFDLVFNALDNAQARQHVNKMCVATNTPLFDCGTAGFLGQCQVIIPGKTECYDCREHPAPKSFAVCTIRSTPSLPIHSIVWAKSFLFSLLFGPPAAESQFDETETDDNREELEKLRKEQNELGDLRENLTSPDFMNKLVHKIFMEDIKRLLSMDAMWENRRAPVPLEVPEYSSKDGQTLASQDQRVWTTAESLSVLADSVERLVSRLEAEKEISFDKDDEDTLDFVAAASNLRSSIFGLGLKSKFAVKEIAGNIIPAIATTNAIVSGLGVIEAMKYLAGLDADLRSVNIWRSADRVFTSEKPAAPNPECLVSGVARTTMTAPADFTINQLIEDILKLKLGYSEVSILSDRLLADPDYDDNLEKTLQELSLHDKFVTVIDDDDERVNLEIYITEGPVNIEQVEIPLRPNQSEADSELLDPADSIPPISSKRTAQDAGLPGTTSSAPGQTFVDLTEQDDAIDLT